MKVVVQLFGPLAEQAGRPRLEVTVAGSTVRDVVEATGLHVDKSVRYARNTDYVDLDAGLQEGDVVSLIPPVGGG